MSKIGAGASERSGIPDNNSEAVRPVITKGGWTDLRKDVRKNEFDRIRREFHNILWGGGRLQGNEIFPFILKMMIAKIFDERETGNLQPYGFQILQVQETSPNKPMVRDEPAKDSATRVNKLYRNAMKAYLKVDKDGLKTRNIGKVGEKTIGGGKIKFVIERLQDISLTENEYDLLGDFFESFLRDEFKQTRGQFFTHQNIVDFIIQALDIKGLAAKMVSEDGKPPLILDPTCGSGTFLTRAMRTIHTLDNSDNGGNSQVSGAIETGRNIFGIDFNEDLALATKVNLIMHGGVNASIEASDGLSDFPKFIHPEFRKKRKSPVYEKPVNEQFDVIVTNPPFSVDLDSDTKNDLPLNFTKADRGSSENLFIERWYQFLKPYGRVGAVLPESVLDTKENKPFRIFIYKHFWIKAIVSLPYLAFQPFTSTKTSILLLQKKPAEEVRLFADKWDKYEERFDLLEGKLKKVLKGLNMNKSGAEASETVGELKKILSELLISGLEKEDENASCKELVSRYSKIMSKGNPFRISRDWWVFSNVSAELDYPIFMASPQEVGYKRLRTTKTRPNDLYNLGEGEERDRILVDTENPRATLDHLRRNVDWKAPPS